MEINIKLLDWIKKNFILALLLGSWVIIGFLAKWLKECHDDKEQWLKNELAKKEERKQDEVEQKESWRIIYMVTEKQKQITDSINEKHNH
jgi:hypothetical protein